MQQNEDGSYTFTFTQEGDETVSLDPDDAGNWSSGVAGVGDLIGTKYGVSTPVLIAWYANVPGAPTVDAVCMASLTQSTAEAIISTNYWNAMRCADLPSGIDASCLDHGFNCGVSSAGRLLQAAVGANQDGNIGSKTVAATLAFDGYGFFSNGGVLSKFAAEELQKGLGAGVDGDVGPETLGKLKSRNSRVGDNMVLAARLFDLQLQHYQGLATFPKYGNGWTARCQRRLTYAISIAAN